MVAMRRKGGRGPTMPATPGGGVVARPAAASLEVAIKAHKAGQLEDVVVVLLLDLHRFDTEPGRRQAAAGRKRALKWRARRRPASHRAARDAQHSRSRLVHRGAGTAGRRPPTLLHQFQAEVRRPSMQLPASKKLSAGEQAGGRHHCEQQEGRFWGACTGSMHSESPALFLGCT